MAASTSSSCSSPILDHPSALLDNTTASVVLTHDRQKDRTAKPSLSSSQLARHSEGAIDARCTLSRRMRTAGYVPLPHYHSHGDAYIPLVDTPINPPPFSPLAIAHLTLSAATPTPIQEHQRTSSSVCELEIPDDSPSVFTSEDMDMSTLASWPLHGDADRPTWATSPCFCDPLEVQARFESAILPFAGFSSQGTGGGTLSTGSVTAAETSVCQRISTPSSTRSTSHLECSFPASSLAGELVTPSTSVSLLGPKCSDTRPDIVCSWGQEYVQGKDETRENHPGGDTHKNESSKVASRHASRKGKGEEVLPSTSSCYRGIDTVPRALELCTPGCTTEVCPCCSLRCSNDTNVQCAPGPNLAP